MALRDFPYIADLIPVIKDTIGQPEGDEGIPTYSDSEIFRKCQEEYLDLWQVCCDVDKNWGIKVDSSLSVTSGTRTVTMPSDCRAIRKITEIDSSGREVGRPLESGMWDDMGLVHDIYVYHPLDNVIYFSMLPDRTYTIRVTYYYHPPSIVHGLARDGGSSTIQLGDHEPVEDDVLNGLDTFYIYAGTGIGQGRTISDYSGSTKTATVSVAFSPSPVGLSSKYTSRPKLPRDARDAFVFGVCNRLVAKLHDERYPGFRADYEKAVERLKTSLAGYERSTPKVVRDDSGLGPHCDPLVFG